MRSVRIKVERVPGGTDYSVASSIDENGWWSVGPTFASWYAAMGVAEAIAAGVTADRQEVEVEILDVVRT